MIYYLIDLSNSISYDILKNEYIPFYELKVATITTDILLCLDDEFDQINNNDKKSKDKNQILDLETYDNYLEVSLKYYIKLESNLNEIEKNKYKLLLLQENKRKQNQNKPIKKRERKIEKKKFMRRKESKK